MAEHQETPFPQNWQIGQEYDPNAHIMKIERYDKRSQRKLVADYLNVQNRLLWFIRDQRALIVAGLAKVPYVIQTDLVEMDRERGWAHYKTFIRDVLGNEVTMYGSESANDFPDFAEKASTKSLGRSLLLLGYGTAFAPEMDEGERIVDTPVERGQQNGSGGAVTRPTPTPPAAATVTRPAASQAAATAATSALPQQPAARARQSAVGASTQPPTGAEPMATDRQVTSIRKLCSALGRPEPELATMTFSAARELLTQLSHAYSESRQAS